MAFGAYSFLSRGMTGEAVREMQGDLVTIGLGLPSYGIDGDFGPETEQAVKDFQNYANLPISGIVDQATADTIKSAVAGTLVVGGGGDVVVYDTPISVSPASGDIATVTGAAAAAAVTNITSTIVDKIKMLDWKWIGIGLAGVWAIVKMGGKKSKRRRRK